MMGRKIPDAVLREAERLKRNRDIINEYGMHVEYLEKTKKLFLRRLYDKGTN